MEEMTRAVVLPFSVSNSLHENPMEITHLKLFTDTTTMLPDSAPADPPPPQPREEPVAMEEGGDCDDLEVRTIPGSDDDDAVSVELEPLLESSCSALGDSSSIANTEFLALDHPIGTPASVDTPKTITVSVEAVAKPGLGESALNHLTVSVAESNMKVHSVVEPTVQGSQASGSGGRSVFLMDYVPLWGCMSVCGRRPEMEDAVAIVPRFFEIPLWMLTGEHIIDGLNPSLIRLPAHFFGVYDGHGGAQVANYCRDRLHLALVEELKSVKEDFGGNNEMDWQKQWERSFIDCFQKVDDEVGGRSKGILENNADSHEEGSSSSPNAASDPVAPETVGSTAVVAVICSSHILIANCGDSRAVLCRGKQPVPLSEDHKPNREDEYARIEADGGKVIQWNGHRVFGVLAMSRSIGDRYLKPWIIPVPEVMIIPRSKEDECLVLASDGLWDVMTNQEVCDVARRRILVWHKKDGVSSSSSSSRPSHRGGEESDPAAQAAAEYLSKLALQKGSKDNISVVVVDLKAQRKFKTKT